MAFFPVLQTEFTAQVGDKIRLDAIQSYVTPDEGAITTVEIDAGIGDGFVDVTSTRYLDVQYSTAGNKTVQVKVTTGTGNITGSFTVVAVSSADDRLFSSDELLMAHEPQILKYLPDGKSSYKFQHRRVRDLIIDEINRKGFRDEGGSKYTAADVLDLEDVKVWATYKCLAVIMEGLSNAVDDIFSQKALKYMKLASEAENRLYVTLDHDNSGIASEAEKVQEFTAISVIRR